MVVVVVVVLVMVKVVVMMMVVVVVDVVVVAVLLSLSPPRVVTEKPFLVSADVSIWACKQTKREIIRKNGKLEKRRTRGK